VVVVLAVVFWVELDVAAMLDDVPGAFAPESSTVSAVEIVDEVESSSVSAVVDTATVLEVVVELVDVVASGMKAGGGVVSTELAAASATPPRSVTEPMAMAMLTSRGRMRSSEALRWSHHDEERCVGTVDMGTSTSGATTRVRK